jgi:hypothetical protein
MRNFKNTLAAITMMVVMGFGATAANAGLILSDKTAGAPCTKENGPDNGILVSDIVEGIIVLGLTDGIIVLGRTDGIIVLGRNTPTTQTCDAK